MKGLLNWLLSHRRVTHRKPAAGYRPRLEALEDRQLLATFLVFNPGDSGRGTLRQAILDANAHRENERDYIQFDRASFDAGLTVYLDSNLPAIMDPLYGYQTVNVESQERNSASLLWWMKRSIALRKQHKVFGHGRTTFLSPNNRKILAYVRHDETDTILVLANLSNQVQPVELELTDYEGMMPQEMFGGIRLDEEMLERSGEGTFKGQRVRLIAPEDLIVIKAVVNDEHIPRHWYDAVFSVPGALCVLLVHSASP